MINGVPEGSPLLKAPSVAPSSSLNRDGVGSECVYGTSWEYQLRENKTREEGRHYAVSSHQPPTRLLASTIDPRNSLEAPLPRNGELKLKTPPSAATRSYPKRV